MKTLSKKRRTYGEHFTPIQILKKFIFPDIKKRLYDYIWVDLFAGEGNLILPILELIPKENRIEFFKKHIYLFDLQKKLVEKSIFNATRYGIPKEIARKNIKQKNTIKNYPKFLFNLKKTIYHITNPPYLYLGYIVKHEDTQDYLNYFKGENKGYQDLYQLALINDLRNGMDKMVYIIPSNFLFGSSVSNKIRDDFFKYYTIKKTIIFEKEIFKHTGTNVAICFFNRKEISNHEALSFEGIKINKTIQKRQYILTHKNHYRAGNEFEDFVSENQSINPIKINFYLDLNEVEENKGKYNVEVIDANAFKSNSYDKRIVNVNIKLFNKITSNFLFIRTVDTGSMSGRSGLYSIRNVFGVSGILVTKSRYRTHPIQLFIEPQLSFQEQLLLKNYFNLVLEYYRTKVDSEFMTTYKYSKSKYTRKYLGLSQVKKLIGTFPLLELQKKEKIFFKKLIKDKKVEKLITFIKEKNKNRELVLWP